MTQTHHETIGSDDLGPYRTPEAPAAREEARRTLDDRFLSVAWGLFIAMIGVLWLLPAGLAPEASWVVGAGGILLGLNAARLVAGLEVSSFTVTVGVIALGSGVFGMLGHELPLFPAFVVAIGAVTAVRHLVRQTH